jgi:hypothetical protein
MPSKVFTTAAEKIESGRNGNSTEVMKKKYVMNTKTIKDLYVFLKKPYPKNDSARENKASEYTITERIRR